jgi:hypothetical protein
MAGKLNNTSFILNVLMVIVLFLVSCLWTLKILRSSDQCDNLNKIANVNIGYGLASSPAVICLEQKIQTEIERNPQSPDIRLCFKPYYSQPYDCVIRIAKETKNYSVCKQLFNISGNQEYKWECIGKVSQSLQDSNQCDAPDQHLKRICQDAQKVINKTEFTNFTI